MSDQIWKGDKLERKAEAIMLERFLDDETNAFMRQQRKQAFVLALDAPYGEGKSWFLSRFRQHLAINHPVAFVDAWVDDANSEPLVSIMAALEDSLGDFLKKRAIKEQFAKLTRAALPLMGKAAIAIGSKALARYAGEHFGGQVKETIESAKSSEDRDETLEAGIDTLADGVSEIVDSMGKALLDQYRTRQRSRQKFKQNLEALARAVEIERDDPRRTPVYVIVDELDRCRPAYAIALLEEIKHLFDVPGFVFVIALHGEQLVHSINAVYGAEFDSKAYLRRFFTRTYTLRRLSIKELVISHFDDIPPSSVTFSMPDVWDEDAKKFVTRPVPDLTGELLTDWGATPREAQAVMDGFRIFIRDWDSSEPIELPFLLVLLLNLVRAEPIIPALAKTQSSHVQFAVFDKNARQTWKKEPSLSFFNAYDNAIVGDLPSRIQQFGDAGVNGYVKEQLKGEYARLHNNSHLTGSPPKPLWASYPDRLRAIGRFIDSTLMTDTETTRGG